MGNILTGTAGWHYPDWNGIVYPPSRSAAFSELTFLAEFVDLCEINSSFYHIPAPGNALTWVRQVRANPRFRFCVKLWQGFTHGERRIDAAAVARFSSILAVLQEADRLAAVLVQFPWSFKNSADTLAYAESLAEAFNSYPLHFEFRHAGWHTPALLDRLRARSIGWVNIDQPVIGASLGPTNEHTASTVYFRLHGRNYQQWFREGAGRDQRYDYLYSAAELLEWLEPVTLSAQSAETCLVVFNNHFKGKALVNSLELNAQLGSVLPPIPERLAALYPRLKSLGTLRADDGTLSLF